MKKQAMMALAAAAMGMAASAAVMGVEVRKGATAPLEAGRVVAVQAMTAQAGQMEVMRVTPFEVETLTAATVTNFTYRPAQSNVVYTATETLWSAWTTNAYSVVTGSVVTVTNGVTNVTELVRTGIVSNLLAEAWGGKPTVAGWPTNVLLYTSQSVARTLSSNVTYRVVDTVDVHQEVTRSVERKAFTNDLWSASVSGYATNALEAVIFPGDLLVGEGAGFAKGKVQLLIEK